MSHGSHPSRSRSERDGGFGLHRRTKGFRGTACVPVEPLLRRIRHRLHPSSAFSAALGVPRSGLGKAPDALLRQPASAWTNAATTDGHASRHFGQRLDSCPETDVAGQSRTDADRTQERDKMARLAVARVPDHLAEVRREADAARAELRSHLRKETDAERPAAPPLVACPGAT